MREQKLRSGENWQEALKMLNINTDVKQDLGI
jgi:hypothetical protein